MRRYRRLLITAIVVFVLLLAIHLVQATINHGFSRYLQSKYPKQTFQLASPVIRLFPLRYELKVYDSQNKFEFLTKSVFSLHKASAQVNEPQVNASEIQAKNSKEAKQAVLSFEQVYSDNYLAQKQAKLVSEQLKSTLTNGEYRQLIERYSIQVSQPISVHDEIVQKEQARLLVRFSSQVKDQATMSSNIQKLLNDLKQLNITELKAVYCESNVLPRNDESFLKLQIPAQTWVQTREITTQSKETENEQVVESQAKPTEVVASGYQYDYFCYTFNYNLAFAPLNADLIQNGLRIKELGGESLERFKRPWHYNYNA